MVQETRAMPPLELERELLEQKTESAAAQDESDLARSLAQLGPRTSVYSAEPVVSDGPGPFARWVADWFAENIPKVENKAIEYGSNSLAKKGQRFASAQSRGVDLPEALELGAAQYVMEKMDRVEDAILRGKLPSDDTWTDVAVYALMIGYVRTNGHWV